MKVRAVEHEREVRAVVPYAYLSQLSVFWKRAPWTHLGLKPLVLVDQKSSIDTTKPCQLVRVALCTAKHIVRGYFDRVFVLDSKFCYVVRRIEVNKRHKTIRD